MDGDTQVQQIFILNVLPGSLICFFSNITCLHFCSHGTGIVGDLLVLDHHPEQFLSQARWLKVGAIARLRRSTSLFVQLWTG